MAFLRESMKTSLSLKTLYESLGGTVPEINDESEISLAYGTIRCTHYNGGSVYYDFYDREYRLCCMDGETCEVLKIDAGSVLFYNPDGEQQFRLSDAEVDRAVFC